MAQLDFHGESMGHVYAQALVNTARAQHVLDAVTEDVRALTAVLDASPQFALFAEAATISDEEKIATMEKVFGGRAHPLVVETLKAMARRSRLEFLRGFIAAYEAVLSTLANRVDVELTSAQPLSPEAHGRVQAAVSKALGKTPDFDVKVDPALLGGLKLRVGDTMIDASVQNQLDKIKRQLQQKGSAALQQKMTSLVS
jgi:F-type H+-transporting ATPase subunit delta